jgi:hypothetical protein
MLHLLAAGELDGLTHAAATKVADWLAGHPIPIVRDASAVKAAI